MTSKEISNPIPPKYYYRTESEPMSQQEHAIGREIKIEGTHGSNKSQKIPNINLTFYGSSGQACKHPCYKRRKRYMRFGITNNKNRARKKINNDGTLKNLLSATPLEPSNKVANKDTLSPLVAEKMSPLSLSGDNEVLDAGTSHQPQPMIELFSVANVVHMPSVTQGQFEEEQAISHAKPNTSLMISSRPPASYPLKIKFHALGSTAAYSQFSSFLPTQKKSKSDTSTIWFSSDPGNYGKVIFRYFADFHEMLHGGGGGGGC